MFLQVSKISVHPSYNGDTYYGDLAVLTLSSDVEYSRYVRPVCVWEAAINTADVEGKTGSVSFFIIHFVCCPMIDTGDAKSFGTILKPPK